MTLGNIISTRTAHARATYKVYAAHRKECPDCINGISEFCLEGQNAKEEWEIARAREIEAYNSLLEMTG